MRTCAFVLLVFGSAALVLGATARPAYAYLDAGTGSMILQLLVGGVAGIAIVGRLYWDRLKSFFGLNRNAGDGESLTKPASSDDAAHHR